MGKRATSRAAAGPEPKVVRSRRVGKSPLSSPALSRAGTDSDEEAVDFTADGTDGGSQRGAASPASPPSAQPQHGGSEAAAEDERDSEDSAISADLKKAPARSEADGSAAPSGSGSGDGEKEELPDVANLADVAEADESDADQLIAGQKLKSKHGKDDSLLHSCTECMRQYPFSRLINAGNARYRKMRCRACHTSVRYLERVVAAQGDVAKNAMSEMRRKHPNKWRAKVMEVRMPQPDDPEPPADSVAGVFGAIVGADDWDDRATRSRQFMNELIASKTLSDESKVAWLTERQFIAHHKFFEGFTHDEAVKKWSKESDTTSKAQKRQGDDGQLLVAVALPRITSLVQSLTSKQTFSDTQSIEMTPDETEAFKRLKFFLAGDMGSLMSSFEQAGCLQPGSRSQFERQSLQRSNTCESKCGCFHLLDSGAPCVRCCFGGGLGGSFGHCVWEFPFVLPSAFPLRSRRTCRALPGPRGHLEREGRTPSSAGRHGLPRKHFGAVAPCGPEGPCTKHGCVRPISLPTVSLKTPRENNGVTSVHPEGRPWNNLLFLSIATFRRVSRCIV